MKLYLAVEIPGNFRTGVRRHWYGDPSAIAGTGPYEKFLAGLEGRGRLRELALAAGHDFTSNDYLGLADLDELREAIRRRWTAVFPPERAARGCFGVDHPEHIALEAEAAQFFGAELALYFSSGFAANYALSQPCPSAAISRFTTPSFTPALMTGCARAGRDSPRQRTTMHLLSRTRSQVEVPAGKGRPGSRLKASTAWMATARRSAILAEIARRYDGMLAIDEAHATGVSGRTAVG